MEYNTIKEYSAILKKKHIIDDFRLFRGKYSNPHKNSLSDKMAIDLVK